MKFFAALKLATYASNAFKAAGLDLEKLAEAGDTNAVKALIDAKAAPDAESTAALAEAVKENQELSAKLAAATNATTASANNFTAVLTATGLDSATITTSGTVDAEKAKAAHEKNIATQARLMVAKAGHPGVLDEIATEPTKKKTEAKQSEVFGRDRLARSFQREVNGINQRERQNRQDLN